MAIASILTSVKKNLGIDETYEDYDPDIIMYINGVFSTLNQIGIGPSVGFAIEDDTATWDQLLENDLRLNSVKTYTTLCLRMIFDPPPTSFAQEAMQRQIKELEWRISTYREEESWTDPDPETEPEE